MDKIHSSVDEMELFAAVNRKFKQIFTRQEHMKKFKTYDLAEVLELRCYRKQNKNHIRKKHFH